MEIDFWKSIKITSGHRWPASNSASPSPSRITVESPAGAYRNSENKNASVSRRPKQHTHPLHGFARRYENGRETSVANRVTNPLKLLSPCSPLGSASDFN